MPVLRVSRFLWPVVLGLFGFLLASFPARNIDLWEHLANGRDLFHGLRSGFSSTSLFDGLLWAGHSLGGEFLVVFAKAVGLGLIAILLYGATQSVRWGWPTVAGVALIVLAISLRANLQSAMVTYILLAAFVARLVKNPVPPEKLRDWLRLAGVLILWANCDAGAVTGVVLLAIVWFGHWLDTKPRDRRVGVGLLISWMVLATLVVFANPGNWLRSAWEWPWPTEYRTWAAEGFRTNRSPLRWEYIRGVKESPAALAYYPLLAIVLLGLVANRRALRWSTVLPSIAFAAFSAVSDRAIPLFAIVAGPIAIRNWNETLARRAFVETESRRSRWLAVGFQASLAVAFLVAAWPGWLQRAPYEPRRWAFDLPPAPAQAAQWNDPVAGRTLHVSAESRHAFRLFKPQEEGVFDAALVEKLNLGKGIDAELQKADIRRIVLFHPDRERLRPTLNVLLRDSYRFPLMYYTGDVAIFSFRDSPSEARTALDLTRADSDQESPADGPNRTTPDRWATLRNPFVAPRTIHSLPREEAALLVMMAEVSQGFVPQFHGLAWMFEQSAGIVGAAAAGPPTLALLSGLAVRSSYLSPPIPDGNQAPSQLYRTIERQFEHALSARDDFLPGTIPLAIRAGRRAVVEQPTDPGAYVILGEAYLKLLLESQERIGNREFKQLRELRQAQAAAALYRAIELSPTPSIRAHELSAQMFGLIGYLDLSLQHREAARAARARLDPNAKPDAASEKSYERVKDEVTQRRAAYEKESEGLRVVDQARAADQLNLPGLALELLLKSDISEFGITGLKLQLELMVRTGRAAAVIEWTAPEQRDAVGFRNYHWWRAQAFAGFGDYRSAEFELIAIGGGAIDLVPDRALLAQTVASVVSRNVIGESPQGSGLPAAISQLFARTDAVNEMRSIEAKLKNLAEVSILIGTLALERGDRETARKYGEFAIEFALPRSGGVTGPLYTMGRSLVDRTGKAR